MDDSPDQEKSPDKAGENKENQQLHLNLSAGKPVSINIGIDSPAPQQKKDEGQKEGGNKKEEDKDKKPSPLKKTWVKVLLIVLAVAVVLALLAWLYYYWTYDRFQQETNDAYLKVDQVAVSPQTSGYVLQVLVEDNQQVKAGDVLVKIDPAPYQAKLSQAQAQIDVSSADIARYEAEVHKQLAQIDQAEAQLVGARSNAAFYTHEADRYRPLATAGAETKEKLDQMENSRREAVSQQAADEAQVSAARRTIETLKAQIIQSKAQREVAEAQAQQAKIDLDYTTVHASLDGRIGNKTVRIGQYMQPGTRMMSLVPLQEIYCEANYKETQVGLMRVGQPVQISVDALPQVSIRGEVESFSPGTGAEFSLLPPENATGNFTKIVQRVPVRIRIIADDDTRAVLVPGLSVETSVNTLGEKHFVDRAEKKNRDVDKKVDKEQDKTEKEEERADRRDEKQ